MNPQRKGAVLGEAPVPTRPPRRRWRAQTDAERLRAQPGVIYDDHTILLPAEVLASIADYTRSRPTGPSAGRVYRRDENWRRLAGPEPEWWVYVCDQLPPTALRSRVRRTGERLPAEDGRGVYHFARRAIVVDA